MEGKTVSEFWGELCGQNVMWEAFVKCTPYSANFSPKTP